MTTYTTATNTYDGTVCPHPDVTAGSGVDVAKTALGSTGTMTALATAMQGNPGYYARELLKDSDCCVINVGPEFGLIAFHRDYQQSRLWAAYSVRSESVTESGVTTQRLRFTSKNDGRLTTLSDALLSVGYPVAGLLADAYEVGTQIQTLNTALAAAKVYLAVWRA